MLSRLLLVASLAVATTAGATTVSWTDWTGLNPTAGTAVGSIAAPSGTVGVSYAGGYAPGPTQTACGTTWWAGGNYNGTFNKPFDCDIIALNAGGQKTITFDTEVTDPYMALMSWNGNTVVFSAPIEVVANGTGFWGSGTPVVNAAGDGFFGQGEVHGIIRFRGTFRSISFTDSSENWHGFTIGIEDRASVPVPAPATLALLLPAFAAAFLVTRRRRQA